MRPLLKRLGCRRAMRPSTGTPGIWRQWSIGVYEGDTPLDLAPAKDVANPVLTHEQVSDVPADFVADPFMIRAGRRWYMFFEVWSRETQKGEIGLAISDDAKSWTYQQIVLSEPFHLSYPYVFWGGDGYYMVPETCAVGAVRLYKATDFPAGWSFVKPLLEGREYVDSSICYAGGRWWLFAGTGVPDYRADNLHLFHAEDLMGRWRKHPQSPVIRRNMHAARPAGRVVVFGDWPIRYAQDCDRGYGVQVRVYKITELTTRRYHDHEVHGSPMLTPGGNGWNASGMHHVDPHLLDSGRWIACVDGQVVHAI